MTTDLTRRPASAATFSIASILAVICAIAAWFVNPWLSILLAIVAIIGGLIGAVVAIAPGKRGGIMSVISVALGAIAIVASIIQIIFRILS